MAYFFGPPCMLYFVTLVRQIYKFILIRAIGFPQGIAAPEFSR